MEGREMEKASLALDPTGPLPVEPEWVHSKDQRSMVIMTNVSLNGRRRERDTRRFAISDWSYLIHHLLSLSSASQLFEDHSWNQRDPDKESSQIR